SWSEPRPPTAVPRHRLGPALTVLRSRQAMVVGLALAATLVYLAIDLVTASGGAVKTQGFATAAFTPLVESTHNNAGDSVCAAGFVPSEQPSENQGDLNARRGSFLESVQLPEGATVSQLTLFANDNDGDDDVY